MEKSFTTPVFAPGAVSHTHFIPAIKSYTLTDMLTSQFQADGSYVQKRFHSGRTDINGGHRDLFNTSGLGSFHFHHSMGPHLPCTRSEESNTHAIVNPFTGRRVFLGSPYVFQGQSYYPLNLITMALTVSDEEGVTIHGRPSLGSYNSVSGTFSACNQGVSRTGNHMRGEEFIFTYPTNMLGRLRHNEMFYAFGNRNGRITLLCRNQQAADDPLECFAYISINALREYMLMQGSFFNSLVANDGSWRFGHTRPLRSILFPAVYQRMHVGSMLTVHAFIQDVDTAELIIGGRITETKTGAPGGNEIMFTPYRLTEADVRSSLPILVEAKNRSGAVVLIPIVYINVSFALPGVEILQPKNGDVFNSGEEIIVSVRTENANSIAISIGDNYLSQDVNTVQNTVVHTPIELTDDNIGEAIITVYAFNRSNVESRDTVKINIIKPLLVTAQNLLDLLWYGVTEEMVIDLNRVLYKYDITTVERIRHFLAQCMQETTRGRWLTEGEHISWSSPEAKKNWFNFNTVHGYTHRGGGHIHLTWDYWYQSFATFMIRENNPNFNIRWNTPHNTGAEQITTNISNAILILNEQNICVNEYESIVNEGANYIAKYFAWESAGFFWFGRFINNVVDNLRAGNSEDVCRVTDRINPGENIITRRQRHALYNEIKNIIF